MKREKIAQNIVKPLKNYICNGNEVVNKTPLLLGTKIRPLLIKTTISIVLRFLNSRSPGEGAGLLAGGACKPESDDEDFLEWAKEVVILCGPSLDALSSKFSTEADVTGF